MKAKLIFLGLPCAGSYAARADFNLFASIPGWSYWPSRSPFLAHSLLPPSPMNYDNTSEQEDKFNLNKGILGAFLGAGLGIGLMWAFYALAGFRFPLLGVGIGVLTGYGARLLFKGTDSTLGYISGGIALVAVVATLFLMYGTFPIISIISVAVSVSVAYRLASTSATI
jgi:hypothetical protein